MVTISLGTFYWMVFTFISPFALVSIYGLIESNYNKRKNRPKFKN